ncbi:MAG: hypothetical protein Q8P41_06180 [Pseudomonadota bacterium]|nr:hypothetical protein [Pseudomonadota bacterium]
MRADRARLAIWVVLGLIAAAYIGVPQAGWVWDDEALVLRNLALLEPTWARVFGGDLWCCIPGAPTSAYYRPLLTVTLLLDRLLFGANPAGFHAVSVLWHLVATGLGYVVLKDRVGPARAAVAALIFGMHPLQSEAVVWVAARNDLLAGAFIFGALAALDRGRLGLLAGCAFLACLSKENAFLLPAIAWMWRRAWGERLGGREAGALGAGIAVAMALRLAAELGGQAFNEPHAALTLQSAVRAAVTVLGWLTWPWPLTTMASLYRAPPSPGTWLSAVASVALLAWLFVRGGPRARWLLSIAAFTYLPALAGIHWYATIGERYLYVPMFGLAAAVAASVPPSRAALATLAVATVAAIGALHVRVPDWANETTLFRAAVDRAPDGFSLSMYGAHLIQQGRWRDGAVTLERAIQAEPPNFRACRSLPIAAGHLLDDEAYRARMAVWLERGCKGVEFDVNLAMVLVTRHQWDLAEPRIALLEWKDTARREDILRAALALHQGDLTGAGAIALAWPGGPSDLVDQAAVLARGRPTP